MIFLEKCDSTQEVAKRLINSDANLQIDFIIAEEMEKGKTTKDNIDWYSPKGNLHLTIFYNKNLFEFSDKNVKRNIFNFILAHSVFGYFSTNYNIENLKIKWPNDIMINNLKVGGILTEEYLNYYITGVAVNLIKYPTLTENFKATSIIENLSKKDIKDINFDLKYISNFIFNSFFENCKKICNSSFYSEFILNFNKLLYKINEEIVISNFKEDFSGIFLGIDDKLNLLLRNKNNNRVEKFSFGEIRFRF